MQENYKKLFEEFDEYVKTASLAELLGLARDGYVHRKNYERFVIDNQSNKQDDAIQQTEIHEEKTVEP